MVRVAGLLEDPPTRASPGPPVRPLAPCFTVRFPDRDMQPGIRQMCLGASEGSKLLDDRPMAPANGQWPIGSGLKMKKGAASFPQSGVDTKVAILKTPTQASRNQPEFPVSAPVSNIRQTARPSKHKQQRKISKKYIKPSCRDLYRPIARMAHPDKNLTRDAYHCAISGVVMDTAQRASEIVASPSSSDRSAFCGKVRFGEA